MKKDTKPAELLERAYSLKSDKETRTLYRDWAETYDKTMLEGLRYTTPRKTAKLLAASNVDPSAPVLDVGSGTGLAGIELEKQGFDNLHALDYSPEMLAEAGSSGVYSSLIEADLNAPLKIKSEAFDGMICTGTFTHAHVGADCLSELFRILKSGGSFACTVHFDVWQSAGFDSTIANLEKRGVVKTIHKQPGTYFETSKEDEGWFLVWQKT